MRESGILMPVSSLPGPYGIGCFGKAAFQFVDFLSAAGQTIWQLLPLSPTGYGDSPYQSCSAFAGNPYFVDLETLEKEGLLTAADLKAESWGKDPLEVDYGTLYVSRFAVLRKAYAAWRSQCAGLHGCTYYYPDDYYAFTLANEDWLEDYALYMALKVANKMKNWVEWDAPYRRRDKAALAAFAAANEEEIGFWKFVQYKFSVQWQAVKAYANEKGVQILGDIPIYVSADSVDAWVGGKLFELDADGRFARVAGCPPDYFSADGQLWGNPLYDWAAMEKDGYGWWLSRLGHALTTYDAVRIDHFRAFASYWAVDAQAETAKVGQWLPGPGMKLFDKVFEVYPNAPIIAEDLGVFGADVVQLLADTGFPGMKVVQFGFDPNGDSSHMPHNAEKNSINYVGTHDNNTLLGWLWEAGEAERRFALDYAGFTGDNWGDGGYQSPACRKIIETVWRSASNVVIIALQDMCGFGSDARMNTPGVPEKNWRFRTTEDTIASIDGAYFRRINSLFRRTYPVFEK